MSEDDEKATEIRFQNTLRAYGAIVEVIGVFDRNNRKGASGQMDCPICQEGTLYYVRSSYNGHLQGQCTKDGCVNWRE